MRDPRRALQSGVREMYGWEWMVWEHRIELEVARLCPAAVLPGRCWSLALCACSLVSFSSCARGLLFGVCHGCCVRHARSSKHWMETDCVGDDWRA